MSSAFPTNRQEPERYSASVRLRICFEEASATLQEYGPVIGVVLGLGALLQLTEAPQYNEDPGRIASMVKHQAPPHEGTCTHGQDCFTVASQPPGDEERRLRREAVLSIMGGPSG